MNYTYDIFLSYSSYDNSFIELIKPELLKNNISFFTPKTHSFNLNFKKEVENAIANSTFFVFICTSDFLRQHHANIFSLKGEYISHIDNEICFASKTATINALKIIPLILSHRRGDENIKHLIYDLFWEDIPVITDFNIEKLCQKLINIVSRDKRIKELFAQAEQSWIYGAYEHAYNKYMALTKLVEGDVLLSCYNKAANCCEKAGHLSKAKRLYLLANDESSYKRIEKNSLISNQSIPLNDNIDQELLHKIANYCNSTIDLFSELLKNNHSTQGLNCLKTSYSRLLNYCKIIGGMDEIVSSALIKIEKAEKQTINSKNQTNDNDISIIKSYRTYLGLDFPESDSYDVFISYKSEDETLARRVYDYLLEQGKRVFFACEILPDMGKTEYREAIMDALDHSQHFVLVTSKLDYIVSNWVKEEWAFFVSKLIEDDHKGNITIITHDEFKVDKSLLPPNLRYKQRLLMSNFKESLLKYLQQ